MTLQKLTLCALLSTAAIISGCQSDKAQDSTLNFARAWCISGGPIYTAIDETPMVKAVAIREGVITYVGSNTGEWCQDAAGANSKTIDLKGAAAYPGFTDAHGHLLGIGLREMTLNLEGTTSIKDLQAKLAGVVSETPKGQTIYGRG